MTDLPTSVHYDAITAEVWIEDSPAYTEEVITGYVCECGGEEVKKARVKFL